MTAPLADIKISSSNWSIIGVLESDNQQIESIIKSINSSIKSLDSSVWHSSEKEQLDTNLLPYLTDIEEKICPYLNECTELLKAAKEKYQQTQESIQKIIDTGSNSISIETL